MSKPRNVTQQYSKQIVEAVETESLFARYLAVERLLHRFFADRMEEFESEIDELLLDANAGTPAAFVVGPEGGDIVRAVPAKNVAEVKSRSGKKNMKVPSGVN